MRNTGIFLGLLICGACFAIAPVQGDLAVPVLTHVFFEKDGMPYNGSVHYTVTCYGYDPGYPPSYHPRPAPGQPGRTSPGAVFSYSATCPGLGCTIYDPYYRIYGSTSRIDTDRCDIVGETPDGTFSLTNFSPVPYSRCNQLSIYNSGHPIKYPEPGSFYYQTGEYTACTLQEYRNLSSTISHTIFRSCNRTQEPGCFEDLLPDGRSLRRVAQYTTTRNGTDLDQDQYIRYLEFCDPSADPDCPGMVIDGMPLKALSEFRPFRNTIFRLHNPCDTFLVRANPSLFISQKSCERPECGNSLAEVLCELRLAIPSDNVTTGILIPPEGSRSSPRSPVESLYCGILGIFGIRC